MTKPKRTTYSVKAIVVVATCPWCDNEQTVTMYSSVSYGERIFDCSQCHKPFYIVEE